MKILSIIIILILIALGSTIALGGQRYNPMEHRWETVPDHYIVRDPYTKQYRKEEPRLRYNPYSREWRYTDPSSRLQYNPFSRKWEWPR